MRHQISRQKKLLLLAAAIILPFGYTYSYDIPMALQNKINDAPYSLDITQFNSIYFFTSLPNIFCSVFTGIFVDYAGTRVSLMIMLAGIVIAHCACIFALTLAQQGKSWFSVFLFGRALFGVFGQNLFTVQTIVISIYAQANQISFLLGVGFSLPWMMNSLNSILTPLIFEATHLASSAYLFGAILVGLTAVCGVIILAMDKNQSREKEEEQFILYNDPNQQFKQQFDFAGLRQMPDLFWWAAFQVFLYEWMLSSFFDNINDMMVLRYGFQYTKAGYLTCLPFLLSFFFCRLWDKINQSHKNTRRLIFLNSLIFSTMYLLLIICPTRWPMLEHVLFLIIMVLTSVAFSGMVTLVIGSIPSIIQVDNLGTAFGVIGLSQAAAMSFAPLSAGFVIKSSGQQEQSRGYLINLLLVLLVSAASICVSLRILKEQNSVGFRMDGIQVQQWQQQQERQLDSL